MDTLLSRAAKIKGISKNIFRDFKSGVQYFFAGMAGFNNFMLLSLVYFIGFGFSFFLHRVFGFGKKTKSILVAENNSNTNSYWQKIAVGQATEDSYYRPF